MPSAEYVIALTVLLLTPGPTNTLMALAGAERGWRGALRLVPAEALAYGLVTLPLALAGEGLFDSYEGLKLGLTLAAACWVAFLAAKLWRLPSGDAMGAAQKGALKIFTTTLCNPKGFVIGLVLLPSEESLAGALAAFLLILLVVSAFWAWLGSLADYGPAQRRLVRRACAAWLAILAVWLATAGLTA